MRTRKNRVPFVASPKLAADNRWVGKDERIGPFPLAGRVEGARVAVVGRAVAVRIDPVDAVRADVARVRNPVRVAVDVVVAGRAGIAHVPRFASPSAFVWVGLLVSGQLSQASARPSPSLSTQSNPPGHTSHASGTPSPSASDPLLPCGQSSQASPTPSPSLSSWAGSAFIGQMSHVSPTPSLSWSA